MGKSIKHPVPDRFKPSFLINFWGSHGGSPTAVHAYNPAVCGSHPLVTPYYCRLGDLLCFCVFAHCILSYLCVFCPFSTLIRWLGLLTCTTFSQITYTVLVETLNTAQSILRARMLKITNDCLTRSGTGCFIAVPIWQQWPSKG